MSSCQSPAMPKVMDWTWLFRRNERKNSVKIKLGKSFTNYCCGQNRLRELNLEYLITNLGIRNLR